MAPQQLRTNDKTENANFPILLKKYLFIVVAMSSRLPFAFVLMISDEYYESRLLVPLKSSLLCGLDFLRLILASFLAAFIRAFVIRTRVKASRENGRDCDASMKRKRKKTWRRRTELKLLLSF